MSPFSPQNVHILIAEDRRPDLQLLGTLLKQEGYQIHVAQKGSQVLKLAARVIPDLILLQVFMTRPDGFDICRQLKANPETREIPVIFLTDSHKEGERFPGLELGAADYLIAPYDPNLLRSRVRTHLRLKFSQDHYQTMAVRDELTGLYNHRYLHERLDQELSEAVRHRRPLSLLLLDIDRFKEVNIRYGWRIGDQILAGIADLIRQLIRKEDIAGRYGGEEFVILLPNTPPQAAEYVAQRLQQDIRRKRWTTCDCRIRISVGLSSLEGGEGPTELLIKAEAALKKSQGEAPG